MKRFLLALMLLMGVCRVAWATDSVATKDLRLHFGGALRFNYRYAPTSQTQAKQGGQLRYDVLSLRPSVTYKKFNMAVDYRLYGEGNGGPMLKYGYLGYRPSERHYIQFGLVPTLLGLQPFGSHGFMFNVNYLMGLEDDSDMGVRYTYTHKGWMLGAAFYKNADFVESFDSKSRFGFDLGDGLQEVNTLHLYASKTLEGSVLRHQIGASGFVGQTLNGATLEMGSRYALAAHYIATLGQLQFKAQYTRMDIRAYDQGQRLEAIPLNGLGGTYTLEPTTDTYNLGLVWRRDNLKGLVDRVSLFSDWSIISKPKAPSGHTTVQGMTGCMFGIGGLETYVELMVARNHPYLGSNSNGNAMARGYRDGNYSLGLNVNIGYYF